jgi:hypothetical protein
MRDDPTCLSTMTPRTPEPTNVQAGGIRLCSHSARQLDACTKAFFGHMERIGLRQCLEPSPDTYPGVPFSPAPASHPLTRSFRLRADLARVWAPERDTTALQAHAVLDATPSGDDVEREIVLAMLLSPLPFDFPDYDELAAALRIRHNIVVAARKTALAFHTSEAERPDDCWRYLEGKGFVIKPGCDLIASLVKATQPEVSGKLYSFSCYRATEYVLLLAIAQELERSNPAMLARLQLQWEQRPIMSGQFHDVFLHEYGSMQAPLPPKYYVPGDRLWFRNPDEHSSDASGYEGSWVFYLGGGLFTNFWKRERPYTLTSKCVEVFHWRHATFTDSAGDLRIQENIVEQRVIQTLADRAQTAEVMQTMLRLRDPQGVYAAGGCIDTSREYPRKVCPATSDMVLPTS